MGIDITTIKDPALRSRVIEALNSATQLKHEIKACCPLQSPQPKSPVCHEPLAKDEGKEKGSRRISVRVTSYRSRLLDPDNLCAKSLVDELRYCGLIPDDRPEDIELTVTQTKCDKKNERTEIELTI